MHIVDELKNSTESALNITKEQFTKTFDYAKIQSDKLKKHIDLKIQERAVLNLKAQLAMRNKTFNDYNDEEIEVMLSSEKSKIIDELKTKSLVAALALLGVNFLV
jgi:hypothetical protein